MKNKWERKSETQNLKQEKGINNCAGRPGRDRRLTGLLLEDLTATACPGNQELTKTKKRLKYGSID